MGSDVSQQQFAQDLLHTLQNHQDLTPLQWSFMWVTMLLPLPFEWKLALYNSLYSHNGGNESVTFSHLIGFVIGFVVLIVVIILVLLILPKIIRFFYYKNQKYVLFFVTPPHDVEQSTFSTSQLFTVIHSVGRQMSWWDAFWKKKRLISCEMVSTKHEGIRYVLRVPEENVDMIEKTIYAYLPGAVIEETEDYLPDTFNELTGKYTRVLDLKLSNHFMLPVQSQRTLSEHDPIAFITAHMTKLSANDLVAMQVVLTPILDKNHKKEIKKMNRLENLIHHGFDITPQLNKDRKSSFQPLISLIFFLVYLAVFIFFMPLSILISIITRGAWPFLPTYIFSGSKLKQNAELSKQQTDLQQMVRTKANEELFEVSIRFFLSDADAYELYTRVSGLLSSLSVFQNQGYQEFDIKRRIPLLHKLAIMQKLSFLKYKYRLLSFGQPMVLSVSEVSSFYHFPYSSTTKTENMVNVKSRMLPAPLGLKQETNGLDNIFAYNKFGGDITQIGLTKEERQRHVYILGATGTGKSTLMMTMIEEDINNNKGICVVDPHGELAEKALAYVPPDRKNDVIYINPDDIDYPVSLNLLELTPGLSRADSLREQEFIAESVVSLFRKVFAKSSADHAHRIEHILRNTIHTAFTLPNPTLFTLFDLLEDLAFRKKTVRQLTDERLKKFWMNEFDKAGNWQQVKMVAPITAKIGRFLFSPIAKSILENPHSTVNIEQAMNEGKIVICNLAKGKLGEDTSEVLGILLLNKIELATLKRARLKKQDRKDFYLYVDEFQNFATPSFVNMLSEARKYHLSVTLAEQTTSQISDKNLVDIIFANVCSVICFRTANTADEERILPIFAPYVKPHEIINLPSFHFYMKIASLTPQEPFSGVTIQDEADEDEKLISEFIELSRRKYAVPHIQPNEQTKTETTKKPKKQIKKQKPESSHKRTQVQAPVKDEKDEDELPS